MAEWTKELKLRISTDDHATKELTRLQKTLRNFGTGLKGGMGVLGFGVRAFQDLKRVALYTTAAAAGAGVATKVFADWASNVETVGIGFQSLTKDIGGADSVMSAMRKGVKGTVSDIELMKVANSALLLGIGRSSEEFEILTTLAKRLGQATGRDVVSAFGDLTLGIARQSPKILDNIGLIVKVEEAYEKYARQLGRNAQDLTENEKRQAFMNATMDAARKASGRLASDVDTAADAWGRFKATLSNFAEEGARAVFDNMREGFDELSNWIEENKSEIFNFFASLVETVRDLVDAIWDAVDRLGKLAHTLGILKNEDALQERLEKKRSTLAYGLKKFPDWDIAHDQFRNDIKELEKQIAIRDAREGQTRKAIFDSLSSVGDKIRRAGVGLTPGAEFPFIGPPVPAGLGALQSRQETISKALRDYYSGASLPMSSGFGIGPESRIKLGQNAQIAMRGAISAPRWQEFDQVLKPMEDDEERKRMLGLEHDAIKGARHELELLRAETFDYGRIAAESIRGVADAISSNMTDSMMDFIDGTKSASEAFSEMATNILKDITRIMLNQMLSMGVKSMMGSIGLPFLGGGAAKGGVFPGHFLGIQSGMAAGGVARAPGLYPLVEARRAEAVVPLPDNRSIPVKLVGGSGERRGGDTINVTVQYSSITTSEEQRLIRRNGRIIGEEVVRRMNSSLRTREGMAA